MSSGTVFAINSKSLADTLVIAGTLGRNLKGGEVIELTGDLGAGKTAFVRGLAKGAQSTDVVQSPTFTINRIYKGKDVSIHHYDFHRLETPGVLKEQLQESLADPSAVTVAEWSEVVKYVLPENRLQIIIKATGVNARQLKFNATGKEHQSLIKVLS